MGLFFVFVFFLISASTYANAILAASTPSSSQAPLTSFSIQFRNKVPGSPIFNKRSQWPDKVKNFSPKFITSNAWGTDSWGRWLPNRFLQNTLSSRNIQVGLVNSEYITAISNNLVYQALAFNQSITHSLYHKLFMQRRKGKPALHLSTSVLNFYVRPHHLVKEALPENLLPKTHQHNSQLTNNTLARSTAAVWSWYYANSLLESKLVC